jgi:hypothetical protein
VTARKISISLLCIAWVALVAAFAGALSTPRNFCNYESAPTPVVVVEIGLVVATIALVAAICAEASLDWSLGEGLVVAGVVAATLAAGIGVVLLTQHQVASWGCG